MTQRHEHMTSSLSASITEQQTLVLQPEQTLTSAFEQAEIQTTLNNTRLSPEQLTHIPDLEKFRPPPNGLSL